MVTDFDIIQAGQSANCEILEILGNKNDFHKNTYKECADFYKKKIQIIFRILCNISIRFLFFLVRFSKRLNKNLKQKASANWTFSDKSNMKKLV